MQYSDFADEGTDGGDPTQFEPTPWGSRQRVLPRRAFKAAVSVVAPPPPPVPVLHAEPEWFAAQSPMLRIESSSFITPIVNEADLQTWRVPKLPPPGVRERFDMRRVDMRLWLPIAGLVAALVLAFFGTRSSSASMSAGLTSPPHSITMARIEVRAPVAVAPIAVAPAAPVIEPVKQIAHTAKRVALAAPVAKQSARTSMRASSKRPRLEMNVGTPLGDLAKHRR